jgi:TonB-dependent SusC/RagA subfamily outer membrane receptor
MRAHLLRAVALLAAFTTVAGAQDSMPDGSVYRGPRFYYAASPRAEPIRLDVKRTPVLARRITVDLRRVTLEEALTAITRQAGLRLMYSKSVVPLEKTVSLRAEGITVFAAITEVLLETDVDVVFSASAQAMLVPRSELAAVVKAVGTVRGRVTEAATGQPIARATVSVAGTTLSRTTGENGEYTIAGVPAGTRTIAVRRLGYDPMSREVTVTDGGSATADFQLMVAATRLSEVVATVTGGQRRLEIGNALARVQGDSVAATTQVRNLPELISGRAPGVLVYFPNGVVGQSPRIRVRGTNSLTVRNDPLVVIDGVRADNSPAVFSVYNVPGVFAATPQAGRLGDLSPDEIESIEIVKGPSAATLYGTDAANGVILVTTKRGRPGRVTWTANTDLGIVQPRGDWPDNFYSWGRSTTGTPVQCTIVGLAGGTCSVDSLTSFNPIEDGPSAPFANGNLKKLGLSASGGSTQLQYFIGGEYNSELGVLRLTPHEQNFLKIARGVSAIPEEHVRPNLAEKVNARGTVSAALGSRASVTVSTGLVRSNLRIPRDGLVLDGGSFGRGTPDTLQQWFGNRRPGNALAQTNTEDLTRSMTSLTADWQPLSWLSTRGTVGLDYSTSGYLTLIKRGDTPLTPTGIFIQHSIVGALYTADAGVTAQFQLTPRVSSRTSVGGQLNRSRYTTTTVAASNLAPGASTAAGAATVVGETSRNENAVAGSYIEEMIGLDERLFVTGAVRFDGASSFGRNFSTAAYPKASISWLALSPAARGALGQSSLRVRSAYGQSGVQPAALATVSRSVLFTGVVGGTSTSAAAPLAIGNPDLRPERQTELEGGVDVEVYGGRVRAELTAYNRESSDALINQPLPFSFGLGTAASMQVNVGKVRNRGIEGLVAVRAIENSRLTWEVQLNGYANQNRLLKLAPNIPVLGSGTSRNVPGFPIFGVWDRPILRYSDANNDGVVGVSEVTLGDSAVFLGPLAPTRSLTALTTLTLLQGRLSFNGMLDRRSGFVRFDGTASSRCDIFLGSCRDVNDRNTPFDRQAAAAVLNGAAFVRSGYVHDGSFTSFRELSVTITTPRMARWVRAQSAALTLAGRNLHTWTSYPGVDVESTNNPGADSFQDNPAVPPSRYFVARARVTF